MCLDVEVDYELLDHGSRRARKTHACHECRRTIAAGESYWFWTVKDGDVWTEKMCAHCHATLELGCALTGCQMNWFWGLIHNTSADDGGFVGDIIANHLLPRAAHLAMLRTVIGRRKGWRRKDGTLLAIPGVPAVSA